MEIAKKKNDKLETIKYQNYSTIISQKDLNFLMEYLDAKNVSYMVAPYEADSQLAFMEKTNQIDFIITEDSDMILYGCSNIINKFNQSGYCELLDYSSLQINSETELLETFIKLSLKQKIWMSILTGCDYIDKVKGVGIKKAIALVKPESSIDSLFSNLKTKCKYFDPSPLYKNKFIYCQYLFQHQIVFNKYTNKLRYLEIPSSSLSRLFKKELFVKEFVGDFFDDYEDHINGTNYLKRFPYQLNKFDYLSVEKKISTSNYKFNKPCFSNFIVEEPEIKSCSKQIQNLTEDESLSQMENSTYQIEKSQTKKIKKCSDEIPLNELLNYFKCPFSSPMLKTISKFKSIEKKNSVSQSLNKEIFNSENEIETRSSILSGKRSFMS